MQLNQMIEGQIGRISELNGANNALTRQCNTLGLTPGADVEVLRRSRGNGPMQIKCSGTLYAIRADEAAQICIALA